MKPNSALALHQIPNGFVLARADALALGRLFCRHARRWRERRGCRSPQSDALPWSTSLPPEPPLTAIVRRKKKACI